MKANQVFIEIYHKGNLKDRVSVNLPKGPGQKLFTVRRLIIEEKVKEIQSLYPYAELMLAFESKMNYKNPLNYDFRKAKRDTQKA